MIRSAVKTLTVQRRTVNWKPAAAGLSAALLVFIPFNVFLYWKYKISTQSSGNETANQLEQINSGPSNEENPSQPAEEQLHYSHLSTDQTNRSRLQRPRDQEDDQIHYAEVKIIANRTPE
ncbi:hypothetical protein ATANTOWER_027031 [Ataeniobius toweri]|uniref:Uncharacterized protein n=1 Tax=Ataeniobius toweri TaxID=208326 RepID=A0ABU7AJ69_9TELE|nr:hypothetical protein [Ataeniobius toweri]